MKLEDEIQQTIFTSYEHKTALNLTFTTGWMKGIAARVFKQYGISGEQYNVLRILRGQKGKAIGVNGIQERMLDKNSNASRLIDKLKEKKLVDRISCENDRRQVEIFITQQGTDLLAEMDEIVAVHEKSTINLTETEAEQLNFLLDKLRTPKTSITK